jgi:beta-glucanase (GH16 family)
MRNALIWSVAVAAATSVVNCGIQGLPSDTSGGGGARAGNGGAAPSGHSGAAGRSDDAGASDEAGAGDRAGAGVGGNGIPGGGASTGGGTGMDAGGGGAPGGGAPPVSGAAGVTSTAGAGGAPTAGAGGAPSAGAGGAPSAGAGGAPSAGAGGAPGETEVTCPTIGGLKVDGHCSSGVAYPAYTGYTLALVEDFPAAIDLNADPVLTWSDDVPNDGQTNFAEGNISFANGHMILTANSACAPANNNTTCYPPRTSYAASFSNQAIPRARPGTGVVSGELTSKYNNYRYGRYEARFSSPPASAGSFLSNMFVFRSPTNLAWNEIDIELEANQAGKLNVNTVYAPSGATGYPGGDAASLPVSGLNFATEHTYAFNWTSTSITWYVDNNPTPVYTHGSAAVPPIPTLSAKIMMNMWVFHDSSAFGDPSKNVYPLTSSYDYFRFYKLNTESGYPCSPTPSCLNKATNDYTAAAQNNPKESPYLQ